MKVLLLITISIFAVAAEDSFSYTNQKPDYIVGKEIEENSPIVEIDGASFSIEPSFSRGLSFDNKNGKISGTPREEYQSTFIVTLTMVNGSIMTSTLDISVWDIPTELTCGFTELTRQGAITDKIACKSNKRVNNWALEFEPVQEYPISISNDGILEFDGYNPIESLNVTIKANNPAGDSINNAVIIVKKGIFGYVKGLNIEANQLSDFICGVDDDKATILHTKSMVLTSLDGFDDFNTAFDMWNAKLDGFLELDGKKSYNWGYTIQAFISAPTSGEYTFQTNSEAGKWDIYIDNKKAFSHKQYRHETNPNTYYGPCTKWIDYMEQREYVKLTAGKHSFKMIGKFSKKYKSCFENRGIPYGCDNMNIDTPSRFMLKWKIPKGKYVTIPLYQFKEPYEFVNFLSFENDYFTYPVGSKIQIPFKFERGKATECTGVNKPFSVDFKKNIIKGTIKEEKRFEMTISCKTKTSKTNEVKIVVDVISDYVKGIVAYYLKSDNFDDTCLIPYTTTTEGVTIEIIKFENNINVPFNPLPIIWDGLTPNFINEFGVNWEGYLKIDSYRNYTFRLTSYHASWLLIDDEEIINNSDTHDWLSVEETIELNVGYHFIKVYYMKATGGSGIELKIKEIINNNEEKEKENNDNDYKDISNYLYFVPRSSFEYTTSYAVYIKDIKIDDNIAFIHGGGSVSNCESNPTLPPGLELTETCTIKGIPINSQEKSTYVITGVLKTGVIANASIQISVIEEMKPQNLHVIDLDNESNIVKELSLVLGNESHYLVAVDRGDILYYDLPVLPKGFTFNKLTGSLTVFPTEYLYNLSLEIRAYYRNDLYISKIITANVTSGCFGNEKVHFIKLENDFNVKKDTLKIQLKDINTEEVIYDYQYEPGKMPMYSKAICLIPGDYNCHIKDNNESEGAGNNYIYFMTDAKLADELLIENDQIVDTIINTVPKNPILKFSENEREEYYLNENVLIKPKSFKLVRRCEISPELPSCLYFNTTTCQINGIVTENSPITKYTISAYNNNGAIDQYIRIGLYNNTMDYLCNKQSKSLIKIGVNTHESKGLFITFYLYKNSDLDDETKKPIISLTASSEGWEENKEYSYSYCVAESNFTSIFRSIFSTGGFGNGYVNISINGIPITKKSLAIDIKEEKERINSITDFNYASEWEYSNEYENGWDNAVTNSTITSIWNKSKLYELKNDDNKNSIYIRRISIFKETEYYSAFSLKVSYKSGIIIKINGKELFRKNLPDNIEITPETLANSKYDDLVDEVFILPIPWLEEEKAIISIELHKHQDEESFPEIDVSLLRIIGSEKDCLILNKYSDPITETNTDLVGTYAVQNGFDNNPNTEWFYEPSPIWGIMRFNEHYHTYFTQFGLIANPYFKLNSFSIEALYKNEWILLGSFDDIEYSNYNKAYFTNYNTSKSYSAIKFSSNAKTTCLLDLNFNLCPVRYCKAIEGLIPETISGNEVTIDCGDVSIPGNRTFYCKNDKQWEEISNTCQVKPTIVYQESKYSFKAGNYYNDIELFVVSGPNLTYSMTPEIGGLKLDELTGKISGQPYKEEDEQIIHFKVSNSYLPEGIIIDVSIVVLPSNEPIVIWTNNSVSLEAGNEYKDLRLFYITGINITYSVKKLPSGLILDSKTGLISGIPTEESNMNCLFKAENSYLQSLPPQEFYIMINITLPISPKTLNYEPEMNLIFAMYYEVLRPYKCIAKTIEYKVQPKLPDGLEFDENTGKISGKVNVEPPSDETYMFKCYNNEGEIENPIIIHIDYSIKPILINNIDYLKIEGGKEYKDEKICRVTGSNLVYQIIPELKSETLKFNTSTGKLNGYITKEFEDVNETVIISGSGEQVSFTFLLSSEIPNKPVIIPSTKKENITLDFHNEIKSIPLFVPVGDNIHITVKPDLPKGLKLDEKSASLSGYPTEFIEETVYVFTVKNPPSEKEETIEMKIGFKAVFCEADSGFPKTPADIGGRIISIKCGSNKSGMKIRQCLLTDENKGIWSKIDDSDCRMSKAVIAGIASGSVAIGLVIVFLIVCMFVRTGLSRKRAKSSAMDKYDKTNIPQKQAAEGNLCVLNQFENEFINFIQ